MTPAVLALDPSTVWLGWALAHLDNGQPIACDRENVKGLGRHVREALRTIHRHADLADTDIQLIYIEGAGGGANRLSTLKVAEAAGEVRQACTRRWPDAPIERLTPAEWRVLTDLPGNCDKVSCHERAIELGWNPDTQDAADAACIATAATRRNQEIIDEAKDAA